MGAGIKAQALRPEDGSVSRDSVIPDDLATPKRPRLKRFLTGLGRTMPGLAAVAQGAANFLLLGAWLRQRGFGGGTEVRDRRALFRHVAASLGPSPILYLEFGVYMGASIQEWSRIISHPQARFIGFDSFEGMPEDFDQRTGVVKGELSLEGRLPAITDPRVSFVKGWFSDTLPRFTVPAHDQLVIHVDCDLYSATRDVFAALESFIQPGTVILFDDMSAPLHEPRAFAEYIEATCQKFELIAYDCEDHYAFRRVR